MGALLDNQIDPRHRVRDVSKTFQYLRVEETPVTGLSKKGAKPKSTLYEWMTRARYTPSDSAIADGVDVQDSEIINNQTLKAMLQGRTQKGRVAVGVDDVAEELGEEYAMSGTETADNMMDALVLSKENMELTFIKSGNSQPYTGSGNPRKLRGLCGWGLPVVSQGSDLIPSVVPASTNRVTGVEAATSITEEDFIGILKSIATASRKSHNLHVFASPDTRARISSLTKFTPAQSTDLLTRRFNQTDIKAIVMMVERMECDFGKFFLHTHYSLPSGVYALLLDMDMVSLRLVRAPMATKLPYLGGVKKTMIEYIFGAEATNPQTIGLITT